MGWLAAIALALLNRWLGAEISAHHMPVCRWLVKFAAARLPADERVAAESEWLAMIEDVRSPTRQLLHSLSLAFSALRIRRAIQRDGQKAFLTKLFVAGQSVGSLAGVPLAMHFSDISSQRLMYMVTTKPFTVSAGVFVVIAVQYLLYSLVVKRLLNRLSRRRLGTSID